MSVSASTLVLAASMALTLPALAAENCAQLPDALQSIAVNHIAQNSELLSLDNKLDTYIKPCQSPNKTKKPSVPMANWWPSRH